MVVAKQCFGAKGFRLALQQVWQLQRAVNLYPGIAWPAQAVFLVSSWGLDPHSDLAIGQLKHPLGVST